MSLNPSIQLNFLRRQLPQRSARPEGRAGGISSVAHIPGGHGT